MKIVFSGGGTGGHIYPIISIMREMRKVYQSTEPLYFYFIGPKDEFSDLLFANEPVEIINISAGKIRRYFTFKNLLQNIIDIFFNIPVGFLQALSNLFFVAPDIVFCKGGYGSIPVGLAAWILQIPVFVHESDAVSGASNKLLGRVATEIFTSFPQKEDLPKDKIIQTGNPIRQEILDAIPEDAKQSLQIVGDKPVIFILGGSQGSQRLNEILLQTMPDIFMDFEVIHQTGSKNLEVVAAEARAITPEPLRKYYHPYRFLNDEGMAAALSLSSLVVGRAGAGTIFDLAATGKPSILIPLPEAAQNHQLENAYQYGQTGAALVIEENNLTPRFFLAKIKDLFYNQNQLKLMAEKAKEFSRPDAARIIANYLLEYLAS